MLDLFAWSWFDVQQTGELSTLMDLPQLTVSSNASHSSRLSLLNRIYPAVNRVFRGEGLQMNELYSLTQCIRHLLKTEMGSFITTYFQNQLLPRGLAHLLEEIQQCERHSQLLLLAEIWNNFFSEILPTLQAIFYPLQGQELTVRQMALLGFRDLVLMKLSLEELLSAHLSLLPTTITQMLLILQGVHEPRGLSREYCRLERMVEMVVSPYLWNSKHTQGCNEHTILRGHHGHPEIRITQYISENSLLAPLLEQEGEVYLEKMGGLRRHTVANAHSDMRLLSVSNQVHSEICDDSHMIDEVRGEVDSDISHVSHTF
ncbi:proline-rich protein 5-like [Chanos chanos]|uniref:Proline-rich protein 5-like n=1 Tax=Chanos chanos TaxID=29144 RepID=A0A6J2X0B9_CHACN|nr:proline-rich protein 5-like [Chanos chanos]